MVAQVLEGIRLRGDCEEYQLRAKSVDCFETAFCVNLSWRTTSFGCAKGATNAFSHPKN